MRTFTALQHGKGKFLVLPLLLLGFLIVPFGLLPAHGLPGHAIAMQASTSAGTHHADAVDPGHDRTSGIAHAPAFADSALSTGHHEPGHGAPFCDAGPDYSSIGPSRSSSDRLTDLAFLFLALVAATAVAIASPHLPTPHSRRWPSRPHWILSGTALLSFVGISRT